jgi:hypothetical protein
MPFTSFEPYKKNWKTEVWKYFSGFENPQITKKLTEEEI